MSLSPIHSLSVYWALAVCRALYQRPGNRGVADSAGALTMVLWGLTVAIHADGVPCELQDSLP